MKEKRETHMIDLDKIKREDSERKRQKKQRRAEEDIRTVGDYIKLLEKDPRIAQNSRARTSEVICGPNNERVVTIPEEERFFGSEKRYPLFANELYGIDWSIARAVAHIEAGKHHASTGLQALLLVGPPATGKSTFVRQLMRAFEKYDERPVYMIKGSPMWEEPLLVVPRYLREKFEKELNVRIKGDLCPPTRAMLGEYTDPDGTLRWWDIPVERMSFSIQAARGLTSFEPSEEKSADVTALTGRENIGVTSSPDKGYNHPRAYEISGKIPKANRGIVEGRELTSSDPQILSVFFSVSEEGELEIQGSSFPHLSVDVVVIGHTNLTPFKKFASNKEYEGLHNRFFVVPFPYPIRIKDELAVYEKLIKRDSDFVRLKKCHIAPGSLELAALFAVMTRLKQTKKKLLLLTKAKLYNGDKSLTELPDADTRPRDVNELLEEGRPHSNIPEWEGMFGVSSRDVLAALNTEIVRQMSQHPDAACLTPSSVIRALRDVFKDGHRMGYSPEDVERFMTLLSAGEEGSVVTEYHEWVKNTVCKAFLGAYSDLARDLFDRYVKEARYFDSMNRKFLRDSKPVLKKDPVSGKVLDPDVAFLRSIEKHVNNMGEDQAAVFRREVLTTPNVSYDNCPDLARAVDKKLLENSRDMLESVLSTDKPLDSEEQKRVNDLFGALKGEWGFCPVCAKETIAKAKEVIKA